MGEVQSMFPAVLPSSDVEVAEAKAERMVLQLPNVFQAERPK
jgi:hypothetical protein